MIELIVISLIIGLCFSGWLAGNYAGNGHSLDPSAMFYSAIIWPVVGYYLIFFEDVDDEEDEDGGT